MHKPLFLLCTLLPVSAQTDVFSANTNTSGTCDGQRAAELSLHRANVNALSMRRADIEAEYSRAMAECRTRAQERAVADRDAGRRADTTCQDEASMKESGALNALDAELASENARHRKAELGIDQSCNPYTVETYARTRARLPATPVVIPTEGIIGDILDQLSNPSDPIGMKQQATDGLVLFLGQEMLRQLVAENIQTDTEARALRSKVHKTTQDRERLATLDRKTAAIRETTKHLRIMYTDAYGRLGVPLPAIAPPDRLNWPAYSY